MLTKTGGWKPLWKAWNEENDNILRTMFDAGHSDLEIAARMGKTRNSIIGRRQRLGLIRLDRVAAQKIQAARASKAAEKKKKKQREKEMQRKSKPKRDDLFLPQDIRLQPDEPHTVGRPFVALNENQCRWSVNDSRSHLMCGDKTVRGTAWCEHHHRRVYARLPRLA